MRKGLVAAVLAFAVFLAPAARGAEPPCAMEEATPVEIAAVGADLDLLTQDGRRIALAGLELPAEPFRARLRALLEARLAAGRLVFLSAPAAPDRWGRLAGGLYVEGEGGEAALVFLAETLLREGLARFRPDPAAFPCRNSLLAAEAEARRSGLGLWSAGEYVVVDAGRPDRLKGRKGMVVVEGVVTGIGEAGGSLYLNFGPKRWADFAVVIWKRNLETFEREGLRPHLLSGRRVRVRGLIDTVHGPRMELLAPAQMEIVGAP
ncbi:MULTISPECIES: thermonuclease family protein [Methylosinus]|uniref:Nuclease (SNase) n=1 Tax=Methylosinus trichosporium (strain ATCC 35070 / NCIMB 11131 / UNIQEM 75 / OB3b) TaxID=595536 RepID=A0A2D2D685_METT3|nr:MULTISPECIES: thermonuclease family protein [Methylosinus]ATQ70483.1 nuclease (SNase) [Methylosinus trichosporium OB3b]OBS51267.1 nuclease (SNase) [Methylosinus sp. 3S-1]